MPSNEFRPGVTNILSDGNLTIPQPSSTGNGSILIIGFANNGPVNNPIPITDASKAFALTENNAVNQNTLFGYVDNPASGRARLGAKFFEALRGTVTGAPDIRVMRLGAPTEFAIDGQIRGDGRAYGILKADTFDAIRLLGRWASTLYHRVYADVSGGVLTLSYGGLVSRFDLRSYPTHSDTVNAINLDPVASQFIIAEVVIQDSNTPTIKERKGDLGDLSLGTQIVKFSKVEVVEQLLNDPVLGLDLDDYLVVGQGTPFRFRSTYVARGLENSLVIYNSDQGTQTTDFAPNPTDGTLTYTAGDALLIPRYEEVELFTDVGIASVENNNPFPRALPIGIVGSGAAIAASDRADALLSLSDHDEVKYHSTFLGGIGVKKMETFVTDTVWAPSYVNTTTSGTGTYTPTPLHLVDNGIAVDLETAAGLTKGLVIEIDSVNKAIPGGFYFGLKVGSTGTPGAMEIYVWDPEIPDDAWISVGTLTDGTASGGNTLAVSGFVAFKATARLSRIKSSNEDQTLKFLIKVADATADVEMFSIIPMDAEIFYRPEESKVALTITTEQRGTLPPLDVQESVDSMATPDQYPKAYSAKLFQGSNPAGYTSSGASVLRNSVHAPPVITIGLDSDDNITQFNASYTVQTLTKMEDKLTDCPIADLNKIQWNTLLDTASALDSSEGIREFGFLKSNATFSSRVNLNGAYRKTYFNGFIARTLADPGTMLLQGGALKPQLEGYMANRWRVTSLEETANGVPISTQKGNLGATGGLGGKSAKDWSNMSIEDKEMALSAALDNIEGYPVDIVVLSDMYLDDVVETDTGSFNAGFHHSLHDWLVRSIRENHESMGVIAVKPFDLGQINGHKTRQYFDSLTNIQGTVANSAANVMEAFNAESGCMSVVCGEPLFNTGFGGSYSSTSEAVYAGLLSSIRVAEATTNKRVRGASRTRYGFTKSQQNRLMQHRYVVVDSDGYSGPPAVLDGVTAAANSGVLDRSDYTRLATVRTVFEMLQAVRAAASPFIGLPNHPTVLQNLKVSVQNVVDDYVDSGYIVAGQSIVEANLVDQVNGNVHITLEIQPAIEIRRIIVQTSLRPSLT